MQTIVSPLQPVRGKNARILILGAMPSPKFREAGVCYGHKKRCLPKAAFPTAESLSIRPAACAWSQERPIKEYSVLNP